MLASVPRRSIVARAGDEKKTIVQDQKDLTGDEVVFKPFDEVSLTAEICVAVLPLCAESV